MQQLKIVSVNRPKMAKGDDSAVTGVSNVLVIRDGSETVIGQVMNERNVKGFTAQLDDGTAVEGNFASRSKAGHAVRYMAQADERAVKAAAKAATPAKTATVSDDQSAKDKRNARRRELRAAQKESANS